MGGKPAARLTDPTAHGGVIMGPGVPTVMVGKMPAATLGDNHLCPMMTPGTPPIPHVGGPITLGSTGVFIGKKPAARMGDMAVCVGPPSSVIMGCPTVLIGEAGSGSQAGSAGSAQAATSASLKALKSVQPMEVKPPQSTPSQLHDIRLQFVDDAGKGLSGVTFLLADHEGGKTAAASDTEGGYHVGGYASAGQYDVTVQSLSDAAWSGSAKDGQNLTMRCAAPGFKDGQEALFQVDLWTQSDQIFGLGTVGATVKGEKIEAVWTFHESHLGPACSLSDSEPVSLQFVAHAGSLAAVSPRLDLGPAKGKYGTAVRAKLEEAWFEEGSDRILAARVPKLRLASRWLATHPGARLSIVLGKVGPENEANPDKALSQKRGMVLTSLLMGRSDLFLDRFARKVWTDKEAQAFLSELHDDQGVPWYAGDITGEWDDQTTARLNEFQRSTDQRETPGVEARFGLALFEILHGMAGKPTAQGSPPLVADNAPNLPDKTTLELYFWIRGKPPKSREFQDSPQSVRDEMDKCVIQDLTAEPGAYSS